MFHLVYLSSARDPFSEEELGEILQKSRTRNAAAGITGLLLYEEGDIIQLLEGEEEEVRKLFRKIQSDTRHSGVIIMLEERVEERLFPGWAMAFRDFSGKNQSLSGYSEFLKEGHLTPQATSKAQRLLNLFRASHGPDWSGRSTRVSSRDPANSPGSKSEL